MGAPERYGIPPVFEGEDLEMAAKHWGSVISGTAPEKVLYHETAWSKGSEG
jgi:hypothetical protein